MDDSHKRDSDKKRTFGGEEFQLDLGELTPEDLAEDLHGGHLYGEEDSSLLFGRFHRERIEELMERAGIFERLHGKGYRNFVMELQRLSEKDQRILILQGEHKLIHMRLKLALFNFRFHPGLSRKRLLYIDWLETCHPLCSVRREESLFPGQKYPGLGIFPQISSFFQYFAQELHVAAIFNMPEYFHDALLFHRKFRFYDPEREALFRALIRDFRHLGARKISRALGEGRVCDAKGEPVPWRSAEMISPLNDDLAKILWNAHYERRVNKSLSRLTLSLLRNPPAL